MKESADQVDVTILIPCFNEEEYVIKSVETILEAAQRVGCSYEILIIDDGSTDRTSAQVELFKKNHPELPIRLHRNLNNYGLARTYIDGAFMGSGKYYRFSTGDNAEMVETVTMILSKMGNADLIIPYHKDPSDRSFIRVLISKTYTWLVNGLSGFNIKYYNGGALLLRSQVMRWAPQSFGFGFQAQLITRLLEEGATFQHVPVKVVERRAKGNRKFASLNIKNFLSVCHTLLEIFISRIRRAVYHTHKECCEIQFKD